MYVGVCFCVCRRWWSWVVVTVCLCVWELLCGLDCRPVLCLSTVWRERETDRSEMIYYTYNCGTLRRATGRDVGVSQLSSGVRCRHNRRRSLERTVVGLWCQSRMVEPSWVCGRGEREVSSGESEREVSSGESEREVSSGESEREVSSGESEREVSSGESEREVSSGESERGCEGV